MNSQDVILGLLHRGPLSGYEIKQKLEMPLSFFFDASFGTIYPTLAKMEAMGYIVKESIVQEGRPNKNVYSLTSDGRTQFEHYLHAPVEKDSYRSDFLVRMFFGEYSDEETLADWIRDEIRKAETAAGQLDRMKTDWAQNMPASKTLCLDIGIDLNASKAQTLREALKRLTGSEA
ncbi:helix-turn-helix transcriptional regulator [Cohnella sp. GCM10012308]|uniref:helix-turn-helix transcriptional regulator n=1 Tax=Cohnella sp. GCM10012308 TaxID=3317329 RepID=UPI00361CB340